MSNWYSSIYKGLIIAGVVAFIIGFFSNGNVSIDSYIAGYSVLILGIMMILIILFNNLLNVSQDLSNFQLLYTIFLTSGPFLLMLCVIAFILYLMITYKKNIIDGHVSSGYYSFSNISVILLLIQLYIVYMNISTPKFDETGKISKVTSSIVYLLGVLTAISSIIMFTILKYFTTDGFTPLKN
jgi:hypothetical protein